MVLHINTVRNIAIDLYERGQITQVEGAKLLGIGVTSFAYMVRDTDGKAARKKYLDELWQIEKQRHAKKKVAQRKRRSQLETAR
jgi:predicted HTH domain antitoxin